MGYIAVPTLVYNVMQTRMHWCYYVTVMFYSKTI